MNIVVHGRRESKIDDSLQRTEEWFEKRKGKFNGSEIKNLMGTGRSSSKMDWNDINKLFDFSDSALKYIYKVGMERLTGISEHNASSFAMSFGTENEAEVKIEMLKQNFVGSINDCESIDYPHEDIFLASSPDGKVIMSGEKLNLEIKSAVSWNGVYERIEEDFDVKHKDFWQVQNEMLVQVLNKTLFVVSLPLQASKFQYKIVDSSPIHQKRMVQRVRIANHCIKLFNENGRKNIRRCLEESISKAKIEWS